MQPLAIRNMRDVTWITPQEAGWMVASNYGRQDILNGKPQKQLLDWIMHGRVASMVRELTISAPDLPSGGLREENVILTTFEWSSLIAWNVKLENFYRSSEVSSVGMDSNVAIFKGIRVSKEDLLKEMDLAGWPVTGEGSHHGSKAEANTASCQAEVDSGHRNAPKASLRGLLPPNASPAKRRDEEYAHAAAELVRSGKRLSEALRAVSPVDLTRTESSIQHAIRRTFELMYDARGNPL